jgi:hypothetical protein
MASRLRTSHQKKRIIPSVNLARKELSERLQLTKETKIYLANLTEASPDSDAKEEAIEFLINLPNVDRINQLNWLMSEAHQAEVERQFQQGVIRNEAFDKDYKHGQENVEETKDTPGASSSKDHVRAMTIKIIKV